MVSNSLSLFLDLYFISISISEHVDADGVTRLRWGWCTTCHHLSGKEHPNTCLLWELGLPDILSFVHHPQQQHQANAYNVNDLKVVPMVHDTSIHTSFMFVFALLDSCFAPFWRLLRHVRLLAPSATCRQGTAHQNVCKIVCVMFASLNPIASGRTIHIFGCDRVSPVLLRQDGAQRLTNRPFCAGHESSLREEHHPGDWKARANLRSVRAVRRGWLRISHWRSPESWT